MPTEQDLEQARIEIERMRVEGDLRLREAELNIRQQEARKKLGLSPLAATVIAAVIGLIGTLLGAYLQGMENIALERQKFESGLILKAIETGDANAAAKNLIFLVKAGFIADPKGQIRALANQPEAAPFLPIGPTPGIEPSEELTAEGRIKVAQRILKDGGFYTGEVNGQLDAATAEAVRKFQKSRGMEADGQLGPLTFDALKELQRRR
jgi:hypothetical protein